jgi:hypothetical protein
MDVVFQAVMFVLGLILLIGFLRIFSIDSSLRQILEILKKQIEQKRKEE